MTAINVGWWNQEQSLYMSFEKAMEKNNLYQGEIETPIQWIHRQSYELDFDDHLTDDIFEEASRKQLELMDNFNEWLVINEWQLNHTTGYWQNNNEIDLSTMSALYQMFLKSKKA